MEQEIIACEHPSYSSNIKALEFYDSWRILILVDSKPELAFKTPI